MIFINNVFRFCGTIFFIMKNVTITGVERTFSENDIIVSKTDLKGKILYGNKTFLDMAGYPEQDIIGAPHSILRHPDMPRCVFKLLWDTVMAGREIFAYVVNRCANGDHYWVFAHVTPSFDTNGQVIGYHSNRRVPDTNILNNIIKPLYKQLLDEEKKHSNRKEGMEASFQMLVNLLNEKGVSYDEFIFSLKG